MKKISIIIPAYNEEKRIKNIAEKLNKISSRYIEVLIIDDGSTDKTVEILKEYKTENMKIVSKSNGGVSSARNLGISYSTGKYILFFDADDDIDLSLVEKILSVVDELDSNTLYFYNSKIVNGNKIKSTFDHEKITRKENVLKYLIVKELLNAPWGKIYSSDIIKKNYIKFDERLLIGEDLDFNLNYCFYSRKIKFLDIGSYYYHSELNNSLTATLDLRKYNSLKLMHNKYKQGNISRELNIKEELTFIEFKNDYSFLRSLYSQKNEEKILEHLHYMKQKEYNMNSPYYWKIIKFIVNSCGYWANKIIAGAIDGV